MKYFIHIPKTAGTSLRAAVCNIDQRKLIVDLIYSGDDVSRLSKSNILNRDSRLLFGHFSFGIHALFSDPSPQYATVMREPVERVASLYRHHCRFTSSPFYSLLKKECLSLSDFVEACITPETNNEMVRTLTASYGRLPLLSDKLSNRWWRMTRGVPTRQISEKFRIRRAINNIENHFSHVGFTSDVSSTSRFFEGWFGCDSGTIIVPHENGFQGVRDEISSTERRVIENANQLDLELYEKMRVRAK
ncbi:hypothetical protein HDE76_004085 [Rhodanobacter sp. ANJX3]|uniref:sulfotransferase family 2 domain-containing protein n=1 Tax=Rhodanobacter sp. ANJX3 TaxID=2723083 RepID=UPI00162027DB|nr:hypothetical protein [Rhodanobacter sp. ANJX3]